MLVGGIASTILPDYIRAETGIDPHIGLLDKPGDLDEGNCDIIDELPWTIQFWMKLIMNIQRIMLILGI